MQLEHIKMTISGVWVLAALVIAIAVHPSTMGVILLGSLGLLPPLVMLLVWNHPAKTMSESINESRRL
jgi:hypothetical protein